MSARQSALTDKAVKLVLSGKTRYSVAKKLGLALSTVYRAMVRHERENTKKT